MIRKAIHVTMHYYPIFGGQEVYIRELSKIVEEHGVINTYIQPNRGYKQPSVIQVPKSRFLHRFIDGFDWFWYSFILFFYRKVITGNSLVFCNYFFHLPFLPKNTNTIVISHGVDWSATSNTFFNRYKKWVARSNLQSNQILVANCSEFLRYRGIAIEPGQKLHQKVAENTFFIPNCVDTKIFKDRNLNRNKVILIPRNIRRSRGVKLAIKAFSKSKCLADGFQMVVAGGPLSGKYYSECLQVVTDLGLNDKVRFLGNVSQTDLIELYNTSAFSVIPTIEMEGTSLSALESMASGCPVVSTDIGGLKDIACVHSGITSEELGNKIDFLYVNLDKEVIRQKLVIEQNFTIQAWKSSWAKIINESF